MSFGRDFAEIGSLFHTTGPFINIHGSAWSRQTGTLIRPIAALEVAGDLFNVGTLRKDIMFTRGSTLKSFFPSGKDFPGRRLDLENLCFPFR